MEKAKADDVFVSVVEHVDTDDGEKGNDFIPPNLKLEDSLRAEVNHAIASKDIDIGTAVPFLRTFLRDNDLDQHIPTDIMNEIRDLLDAYSSNGSENVAKALLSYYYVFHFHSPYLEVRESIPNTDDPTLPVETFRAWAIGLVPQLLANLIGQFFSLRWPMIEVEAVCIQILGYPAGKLLERILPTRKFHVFGVNFTFNPGPFNQKEHMLITIMANVSVAYKYATSIFVIQILPMFFNQTWARSVLYQICISISMQCMGYGLAGLGRTCIVFPDYCIYPRALATVIINRSLHEKRSGTSFEVFGTTVTRYRYLLFLGCAYFIWHIIGPGYLFEALSNFNWPTWIDPKSKTLAFIFGNSIGLGFNPFPTLDWIRSSTLVDPIVLPYFTVVNFAAGMLLAGLGFMLPCFLKNVWYSGYIPFNRNGIFDRFGKKYNVRKVVDERGNLDIEKYRAYSPLYSSIGYATAFIFFFAIYSATFVHAALFHHRQILTGFKSLYNKRHRHEHQNDIHNRLMRAYDEVPHWWYVIVYASAFILAAAALAKWVPEAPLWLLIFCAGLGVVLLIPFGIVYAVSGVEITLNVISELVGGFAVPGKAIAMNMFKSYGCMVLVSAIQFSSDLKLGHYAKIPPRSMFRAQLIATVVATLTAMATMNWQVNNIKNLCVRKPDPNPQQQRFTCDATAHTLFASSIIWGTIGPERMYGSKGLYSASLYGFVFGAILPIPIYLLAKWKYPQVRHVYPAAYLYGGIIWAPFNFSWVSPALWIGYLFSVHIKKRYLSWWGSFNYLTSAALTLGAAFASFFVFFALQFWDINVTWWGNEISDGGLDSNGYTWYSIPEGGFGPVPGEFQ